MENEAIIRLSIFLGIFGALSLVEVLKPRRARVVSRKKRWFTNWGIILVDTLALRLLALVLPMLAVGAAVDAHALGLGSVQRLLLYLQDHAHQMRQELALK
jgi:hypothetical protein